MICSLVKKNSFTWGGTHNNYFNVSIQGCQWNYSRCLATAPLSKWNKSESFSVGCILCILRRPQQCPCLDQFNGNAYFSGSRTNVQSQWYWSQYSHWNNFCPHSRHLLSHPTILKNCLIYNLTPLALLVNDHQIRPPRPNFMEDRKQQWLEPGF